MHGKIFEVRCTSSDCTWSTEDFSSPLCPALGNASDQLDDIKGSLENESIAIPEKDLPHCPECGSLARPGVVWFGETPRFLSEINLMVFQADLCLVVGTSSTVRLYAICPFTLLI
jgi:NAD-dependent deacetylase sirtuin 5